MIKELGIDPTVVDTTAQHELGAEVEEIVGGSGSITRVVNNNGIGTTGTSTTTIYAPNKRYRYCKATAAIAQYDAVQWDLADTDKPYAVKKTAATTDLGIGICEVAGVAVATPYFWLTIRGYVPVANVATGTTAGKMLAPSGTAGRLDLFTFTTTAATLAQLEAGVRATLLGAVAVTDAASNLAAVYLFGN